MFAINKLCYVAFTFLCLIGLCYQLYLICSDHLEYNVTSSIKLLGNNRYKLTSLSTCFKFQELFDYNSYNREYNSNIVVDYSNTISMYESGLKLQSIVTVNEVMKFTPSVDHVMSNCEIRNSSNFKYHYYDKADCYDWFNVEKYFLMTEVCYKFTLKTNDPLYTLASTFLTPTDIGDLIFIFINETAFDHFNEIRNIMHPAFTYPTIEVPLSRLRIRSYNPVNGSTNNIFQVQPSFINTTLLPPPYVTECQDYKTRAHAIFIVLIDFYNIFQYCPLKYSRDT